MSKVTKDNKSRPEVLRQPQRKDSLSSVLSWAGLQTKPGSVKSPGNLTTASSQSQSSSAGNIKSRRHSYGPDGKKKARDGSVTSRRLSLSSSTGGTQEAQGTKTRNTKAVSTVDSRNTDGVSTSTRTSKSSSTEKVNKQPQDTSDGSTESLQKPPASGNSQEKTSSIPERPTSPKIIPKSILRVSSPDGQRPPRRIIAYPAPPSNNENGQQSNSLPSPLSPLDQTLPGIAEDAASGSPPNSPIARPLSPGATVRFAKATIHRVEVGPGRRFAPVKRKSKSTLTYIAPLDPGAQKATPKNMLSSPTKLRRHVENQKAMGRYWMRTEEEEAQWRAEAAMRAAEEAERYRAEPASPPGPAILANSPAFHGFSWADGLEAQLDKLPPIDSLPSLDKLETEEAEDKLETVMSDSDESDAGSPDSGVKIFPMDGDQDDHQKMPMQVEQNQGNEAQADPDPAKAAEIQKKFDEETNPKPSSMEAKTGRDGEAATATSETTIQEAKMPPSRPATGHIQQPATTTELSRTQTLTQSNLKTTPHSTTNTSIKSTITTTTSGSSKQSLIPSLTLSRPTSPSPRRISSHRALSPSPSRPIPSKSQSATAIMESRTSRGATGPERPHTPGIRSASANHLHLSGRRGGSTGRRVLFEDGHAKHEIAT